MVYVGIRCSDTGYSGRIGLNLGLDNLAIRGIGTSYRSQFTGITVD
jgi:hypothetical protein